MVTSWIAFLGDRFFVCAERSFEINIFFFNVAPRSGDDVHCGDVQKVCGKEIGVSACSLVVACPIGRCYAFTE